MIKMHLLPKHHQKALRRLGRGPGSGRGKTAGRGTKGQKSRETVRMGFEGGQLPLSKRLPLYRGRGRNKAHAGKVYPLNIEKLANLPKGSVVSVETLIKHKLVNKDDVRFGVKLLNKGNIEIPLTIQFSTSKSAAAKIEAAGGKIEIPQKAAKVQK